MLAVVLILRVELLPRIRLEYKVSHIAGASVSVISKCVQRRLKLGLWSEELVWREMALVCLFSGHLQFALRFFCRCQSLEVSFFRAAHLALTAVTK